MKKVRILIILSASFLFQITVSAQSYVEIGTGIGGDALSPVFSLHKNWELGKAKKFVVGTGLRYTGFFGKDINFTSAPNDLAIEPANVDTLFGSAPAINSLNLLINLGYNLSPKIQLGFNIDAIGFAFGPKGTPTFINNGVSTETSASPTSPNILLVGNNDKGSLNSHFYGTYQLNDKWGLKLAYQYLFNELTTSTPVQSIPSSNDRFRVKSSQLFFGINYSL